MDVHEGMTGAKIPIWFQALGDRNHPAVLLIMGQGGQATSWGDDLCRPIVEAGYLVVRFDNRDAGLSGAAEAHYLLEDMALDALSVLDALDLAGAHFVGQSMGGMIAQEAAITHGDRVTSLSLLSTSPDPTIARPSPDVAAITAELDVNDPQRWADAAVDSLRIQTGSRWPFDEQLVRSRVHEALQRSFRPQGAAHQLRAIVASPARTERLKSIDAPTIVVHGDEDPVLPPEHAIALASAVEGASLHIIQGMGHALPWGHWDIVLPLLLDHFDASWRQPSRS